MQNDKPTKGQFELSIEFELLVKSSVSYRVQIDGLTSTMIREEMDSTPCTIVGDQLRGFTFTGFYSLFAVKAVVTDVEDSTTCVIDIYYK